MDKNESLNEASDEQNSEFEEVLDSSEEEVLDSSEEEVLDSSEEERIVDSSEEEGIVDSSEEKAKVPESQIESEYAMLVYGNVVHEDTLSNLYGESRKLELSDNKLYIHDLYIDHSEIWIILAKMMGTYHPHPWTEFYLFIALKRAFYNQFGVVQLNSWSSLNFMAGLDLANRALTPVPLLQRIFDPQKLPAPILHLLRVSRQAFRMLKSKMRVLGVLFQVPFVFPKKRKKAYRAIERNLELPILIRTTGPLPWIQIFVILIIPVVFYKAHNSYINCVGTLDIEKILSQHKKINNYIYQLTREIKLRYNPIDQPLLYGLYIEQDFDSKLSQLKNLPDDLALCINQSKDSFIIGSKNENVYAYLGVNINQDDSLSSSVNEDDSASSNINADKTKNTYTNGNLDSNLDSSVDNDADENGYNHDAHNCEENDNNDNDDLEEDYDLGENDHLEEDYEYDYKKPNEADGGNGHFQPDIGNGAPSFMSATPEEGGNGSFRHQPLDENGSQNDSMLNKYLGPYIDEKLHFYKRLSDIYKLYKNHKYQKIKAYIRPYDTSYQILVNHINKNIVLSQYPKGIINRNFQIVPTHDYKKDNISIDNLRLWYDAAREWHKEQQAEDIILLSNPKILYLRYVEFFNQVLNFSQKSLSSLIEKATPIIGINTINNIKILKYNFIRSIYFIYNNVYIYIYSYVWKNISYIYISSSHYIDIVRIFTKLKPLLYKLEEAINCCTVIIEGYVDNSEHINRFLLLFENQVKVHPSIKEQITVWNKKFTIITNPDNDKHDESINTNGDIKSSKIAISIEYNVENQTSKDPNSLEDKELSIPSGKTLLNELTYEDINNSFHQDTKKLGNAKEKFQDETVGPGYETHKDELIGGMETEDKVNVKKDIFDQNHAAIEEIVQAIDDSKFQPIDQLNNEVGSSEVIEEEPDGENNIVEDEYPDDHPQNDHYSDDHHTNNRSITNISRVISHNILQFYNNLAGQNKLSKNTSLISVLGPNNIYYRFLEKFLNWIDNNFKVNPNDMLRITTDNKSLSYLHEYSYDPHDISSINYVNSLLSNYIDTSNQTIFIFNHLLSRLSYSKDLLYSLLVDSQKEHQGNLIANNKKTDIIAMYMLANNLLLEDKQTSKRFLSLTNNIYRFDELFGLYTQKVPSAFNNISIESNSNIGLNYNQNNTLLSEIAFIDVIKGLNLIQNESSNKKNLDNNLLLASNKYIEKKEEQEKYPKFDLHEQLAIQNIDETLLSNVKDSFVSSHVSDSSFLEFYGTMLLTPKGYSYISDLITQLHLISTNFVQNNIILLESIDRYKNNIHFILVEYPNWIIGSFLSNPTFKYLTNYFNEFLLKDVYNELKRNNLFPNIVINKNYTLAILILSPIVFVSVASSAGILFFFYWTWRKLEDCINMEFPTRYTTAKILIDNFIISKFRKISVKPIFIPTGGPIIETYKAIYYLYMYGRIVPQRLMHTKSGDLLRLERSTAEKYLITNRALLKSRTNLKQKIGQSDYYGSLIHNDALNTLQGYTTTYHSAPTYLLKHRLLSCTYKYIYYAVYSSVESQRLPESVMLTNLKPAISLQVTYKRPWSLFPISFQTLPSRGYLIVGDENAGKTYLTKSLAANTNLSLVYISIEKTFATKLDLQAEINFNSNSGMRPVLEHRQEEIDSRQYERLIKMQVLFRLAEKISPCIVWIPLLERYTTNFFRNDATLGISGLSLFMIVKTMERTLNRDVNPKIMFVGGSENTRELDPILLHPQRFDTLVRLENPTPPEREISVLSLLHTEGIEVTSDFKFETVQNATMGYTMRHIGSLVDNILRTCSNLDSTVIDTILMDEVVQRQQVEWDMTFEAERKYIASRQFVAYKVGKAIVKKQILPQPLFHSRSFWQIKFYYLSKWFLESRPKDSTITEILMLPYFYSSLAGIAARDAWIMISLGRLSEHIVASEILEDDVDIALNLFRAYHSELGFLSLNNKSRSSILLGNQRIFSPDVYWKTGRSLSILGKFDITTAHYEALDITIDIAYDENVFRDSDLYQFTNAIVHWSPYFYRMPMYRSFLLDVEKHVNEVPSIYSLVRYGTAEQFSKTFRTRLTDEEYWKLDEQHFYRMDNIEPTYEELLVDHAIERKTFMERRTEEMEWMVDSQHDTVDRTEYHSPYKAMFAISGKCIWDPKPIHPRHLEFRNRDLLANRLVMSTLYTVYEDKVTPYTNPFLFIKKPFWFRDEAKEKQEALIQEKLDITREANTYIKEFLAERKKLLMEIENFHTHKLIARVNSRLLRPKCYKKTEGTFDIMIGKNPLEGLVRYNVLFDENLYQATKGIQLEIFIHKHLLDTYNGLYKWFIKNHRMFAKLTDILYSKGVLWPEQIKPFGKENSVTDLEEIDAPILPYTKYLLDQRINLRIWYNLSIRKLFKIR